MKSWRCLVCGYIHNGDSPPEFCPVCGAPKTKFELIEDKKEQSVENSLNNEKIFETDVLVIGSGASAFSAAVTAKLKNLDVMILEKATSIGGTSARSGGGMWIPINHHQKELNIEDSKDDAIKYMARYSFPHLYQLEKDFLGLPKNEYELIVSYVEKASEMLDFLTDNKVIKTTIGLNWEGGPQIDYGENIPENKKIRGRTIFPKDDDGNISYGYELISQLSKWADKNDIKVFTNCSVYKIITDENNSAIGVLAILDGEKTIFKCKKGIIFGTGGYSHNPELMLHLQRGPHFGGCSVPTNTGDFIKIGEMVNAKIGNTAGAFRTQAITELALSNPGGSSSAFYIPGDSFVEVNKHGKRVMNEKRNYNDRTMVHFEWDNNYAEWVNMLLFLIYDERTASLWSGSPPYPVVNSGASYVITGNTIEELGEEISKRLNSIKTHTGNFELSKDFTKNLKSTLELFNKYAKSGKDLDFCRGDFLYDKEWTTFPPTNPETEWPAKDSKNISLYPISEKGPYHAIILSAGTLDTSGGPVINKFGQVLDINNDPIRGLYGCGNCIASPSANAYWGAGGTLGPGMTFGYISANHISNL